MRMGKLAVWAYTFTFCCFLFQESRPLVRQCGFGPAICTKFLRSISFAGGQQ